MAYKICEYCGKEFEASRPNQIYCSKECGKRNWNEQGYVKIKESREGYTTVKGKMLADWCNENGEEGQKLLAEYSSKNESSSEKVPAGSNKKAYLFIMRGQKVPEELEKKLIQREQDRIARERQKQNKNEA